MSSASIKSILIVDDETIVLDVLQRILLKIGYCAMAAGSGKDALKLFSQKSFDLILMDVLMPEKNGFEIAKEMRETRPEQKIVMITGLGEDAAEIQADVEKVDIDRFLSKPFSFDKIKTLMADVLVN